MKTARNVKFKLGMIVATPGVIEALDSNKKNVFTYLSRHILGDWGDLDEGDAKANDAAVESGEDRIFSAYHLPDKVKIWIVTEWDRSATTILLPSEY